MSSPGRQELWGGSPACDCWATPRCQAMGSGPGPQHTWPCYTARELCCLLSHSCPRDPRERVGAGHSWNQASHAASPQPQRCVCALWCSSECPQVAGVSFQGHSCSEFLMVRSPKDCEGHLGWWLPFVATSVLDKTQLHNLTHLLVSVWTQSLKSSSKAKSGAAER